MYQTPRSIVGGRDAPCTLHRVITSAHQSSQQPRSPPDTSTKEAYKGPWSEAEDEYLRRYTEVRNANPRSCDSSICRTACVEGACAHHWCSEEECYHSRCTDRDCVSSNHVHRRQIPRGLMIMVPLEDTLCRHLINTEKLWTEIANLVTNACGRIRNAKQCRERWFQQLRPGLILNLPIQAEEGELITQLVREKGPKWADISRHPMLQRRSDNCIKNWWNSSGNKKDRLERSPTSVKYIRNGRPVASNPNGIQRNRTQYSQNRSAAALSQIYQHALDKSYPASLPPITSPLGSAPLPPLKSPLESPHLTSYNSPHLSQPRDISKYTSPSSHSNEQSHSNHSPTLYHGRRRESTASIATMSGSTNDSSPNTPSTSKSFFTGNPIKTDILPPTLISPVSMPSPKDTRMAITNLCS